MSSNPLNIVSINRGNVQETVTKPAKIKRNRAPKVIVESKEATAAERISEIDEQVEELRDERRMLLERLDKEIAELQRMRNKAL